MILLVPRGQPQPNYTSSVLVVSHNYKIDELNKFLLGNFYESCRSEMPFRVHFPSESMVNGISKNASYGEYNHLQIWLFSAMKIWPTMDNI